MPRIANRILAATEPATEERRDALVAAARDRADRTLGGLAQLLEERPELGACTRRPTWRPKRSGGPPEPAQRRPVLNMPRTISRAAVRITWRNAVEPTTSSTTLLS